MELQSLTLFTGKNFTGKSQAIKEVLEELYPLSVDIDNQDKYIVWDYDFARRFAGNNCRQCYEKRELKFLQYIFPDVEISKTFKMDVIVSIYECFENTGYKTIVLKNPETNLHPEAQSLLGQWIANFVEKTGRQVIIETHSDHILNGVAVMVAKEIVNPDNVICYQFYRDTDNLSVPISVPMLPNGQWSEHGLKEAKIKGFFDQILIDNAIILNL